MSRRHFTIVNRKVCCSFTCDGSTHRGLFIFLVPLVPYMQRIFLWLKDYRWIGLAPLQNVRFVRFFFFRSMCVHYIEVFFIKRTKIVLIVQSWEVSPIWAQSGRIGHSPLSFDFDFLQGCFFWINSFSIDICKNVGAFSCRLIKIN